MTVRGKGRVIRDTIRQIEAAKPAISEVQMHFFAKPTLGSDAEAIADHQHADQQFRINRRATSVAVEIRQVSADAGQVNKPINRSNQVIMGNVIFKRELVEQGRLRLLPRSHHRQSSRSPGQLNQ